MSDIAAHLETWSEIGMEEANRLRSIPDIHDNPAESEASVALLEEHARPYLGSLSVVLSGPDITLVDDGYEFLRPGSMAAWGTFCGGMVFQNMEGEMDVGYFVELDGHYTMDELEDDDTETSAVFAVGSVATTNIWAPDDIFMGEVELLGEAYGANSLEARRLDSVEKVLREAVSNEGIKINMINRLFKSPDYVSDGLELEYFLRRLNAFLQTEDLVFTATTTQIYIGEDETDTTHPILDRGEVVSLLLARGSHFDVIERPDGQRTVCLLESLYDDDDEHTGFRSIDIEDIEHLDIVRKNRQK